MKERRTTMGCQLARRAISRAEDRGEETPRWVARHTARCGSCRDFALFTASLRARLADEKPALLSAVPDFPVGGAAWASAAEARGERKGLGRRLVLHPAPAVAAALVLVAAGVLLFRVARQEAVPSPQDTAAVLAALRSVAAAPAAFPEAVASAETSLDKERRVLEASLASAVEYLQARLNVKIERRKPASKSS
jgi:hypothetical protein